MRYYISRATGKWRGYVYQNGRDLCFTIRSYDDRNAAMRAARALHILCTLTH